MHLRARPKFVLGVVNLLRIYPSWLNSINCVHEAKAIWEVTCSRQRIVNGLRILALFFSLFGHCIVEDSEK